MAMALFEWPSRRLLQLNQLAAEFLGAPMAALLEKAPSQWRTVFSAEETADFSASLELAGEFPTGVRREVIRPGAQGVASRV